MNNEHHSTMKTIIKLTSLAAVAWVATALFSQCSSSTEKDSETEQEETQAMDDPRSYDGRRWTNGLTYEIFIHAFADGNGDGIGDFKGATQKLDYLAELGVEGIWLMPIHESPSYHKYDVVDYRSIHPDYGTMEDFKTFLNEAHKRGIKVIIDFVINHSGRDHIWFQEAIKGKDNPYRDFYVWKTLEEIEAEGSVMKEATGDSPNPTQWHEREGEDELYYGFFWGGMPDLNYDHQPLRDSIYTIGKWWLTEVGVDGFRLDAAKHIYQDYRMEDSHAFWVEFREEMESAKPDVFLVGEVWDEAEVVAPFLAGLHAVFNFDLGWSILNLLQNDEELPEDRTRIDQQAFLEKYAEIRKFYMGVTPHFVDATFLTNHDQNRIMSELSGDEVRARMAANLLFTLPGSPFIYYGEEIGMKGVKPDEEIREPMVWGAPGEDPVQSTWREPVHSTHEAVTPANQQYNDKGSLWAHYQMLVQQRKASPALLNGAMVPVDLQVDGLLAYYRQAEDEKVLLVHNLTDEEISLTQDMLPEGVELDEAKLISVNEISETGKLRGFSSWMFSVASAE
ncbi:MAG TPA: alpha-amylase [Cytophagales bacterium]|nr:alpha-amylase [Cytophagales bacterium]